MIFLILIKEQLDKRRKFKQFLQALIQTFNAIDKKYEKRN